MVRRALSVPKSSGPQKAPPLQLKEWLSGSPQNMGNGSHLVLNFVQEANPRCANLAFLKAHAAGMH